jgi:hypothetical protein
VLAFEKVEAEVVEVVQTLAAENSKVRATLLECADLPPYAHVARETVGLPVDDIDQSYVERIDPAAF